MQKKGQITLFIIVGILILIAVGMIFALKVNSNIKKTKAAKSATEDVLHLSNSVQAFVQSCLQKTAEESLIFIGQHGGYYQLPKLSHEKLFLPYYFYDNMNRMPTKEEIEFEISSYVNENMFFCFHDFQIFKDRGYTIKQQQISTVATINPRVVNFDVSIPITVEKGEAKTTLEKFSNNVPSKLGTIHNIVSVFIESEEKSSICVSCLTSLSLQNEVRTEMSYLGNDQVLFNIIDEKTDGNNPYHFKFINQYNFKALIE